jgi:hypothetical protein
LTEGNEGNKGRTASFSSLPSVKKVRFKPVRFQKLEPSKPPPLPLRGAGDLVALVAKPIARTLDRVAGTRLQDCDGCEARQAWLNERYPLR